MPSFAPRFSLALLSAALLGLGNAQAQRPEPLSARAEPQAVGLIIKFRENLRSPLAAKATLQGFRAMGEARGLRTAFDREGAFGKRVIRMAKRHSVRELEQLARDIQASDATIESIEIDHVVRASFTPNDTRWSDQWALWDSVGGIKAPQAWDISQGFGQRVAVLDTGVLPHADLVANLLPGYDLISDSERAGDGGGRDSNANDPGDWVAEGDCGFFEPAESSSWHGTHVAGTIAAVGNNAAGVTGVAPKTKIVPVRVLGKCGGAVSDVADGIVWAVGGKVGSLPLNANPARILNLSLGGEHSCSSAYQDAINLARQKDALIVVSAGNDNQNVSEQAPANCNGVMVVAATNRLGAKAGYSNFGNGVDIAAPGGDAANGRVLSLGNTGSKGPSMDSFAGKSGTSMAAPHVAGVAALMLATNSLLKAPDTAYLMKSTARSFPGSCSGCGAGLLDAAAAVSAAKGFRYEIEPNDTVATAQYLNLNWPGRVVGTLLANAPEKVDVYSAYLPAGNTLRTELTMVSIDPNFTPSMEVLDVSGKVLKTSVIILGKPEANYYNGSGAGMSVYLRVKGSSGGGISYLGNAKLYDLEIWRVTNKF